MAPKGHWPRGKPRHPETATPRVRRQIHDLRRFFARHADPANRAAGKTNPASVRSAATVIGVSDRTIRRWLTGRHHPSPQRWRALIAWRSGRPER